jgi:hypothetical protein
MNACVLCEMNACVQRHHDPRHIKGAQAPVWIMVGGAGCDEMEAAKDATAAAATAAASDDNKDRHHAHHKHGPMGVALPLPLPAAMEMETAVTAGPPGSENVTSDRYATGVLEANQTTLYWRLVDSIDGSLIDEVYLTR